MIDIVYVLLALLQSDQVLHDGHDIFAGQRCHILFDAQSQLRVHTMPADITKVIAFRVEEQSVDQVLCRVKIRRLAGTKLRVDGLQSIFLGACNVAKNRIRNDRAVCGFRLQHADLLDLRLLDLLNVIFRQLCVFVDEDFACLLVEHITAHGATDKLFQVGFICFDFLHQLEQIENLIIRRIAQCAQERRHREFLLAIDVGIHHVVDVRGEFNPRPAEGDDAGRIHQRPVWMNGFAEEHAGRAMELTNDNAFRAVDDERSPHRHRGEVAQVHFLFNGIGEFLASFPLRGEAQLRFQRNGKGESPFLTFNHRVLRFLHIVLRELQQEVFAGVGDWKIHFEDLLQTKLLPPMRRDIRLQKPVEGICLDVQQVWGFNYRWDTAERNSTVRAIGLVFQFNHSF